MKTSGYLCILMLVIFALYPAIWAEDWQLFHVDVLGDEFYYDKDSIVYPSNNTVQVAPS